MDENIFEHLSTTELLYALESYEEIRTTLGGCFLNSEEDVWDKHIKLIDEEVDKRIGE